MLNRVIYMNSKGISNWKQHMETYEDILEILIIQNGKGNLFTASMIIPMHKGQIVIKNPGISHGENAFDEEPLELYRLQFSYDPSLSIKEGIDPVIDMKEYEEILLPLSKAIYERQNNRDKLFYLYEKTITCILQELISRSKLLHMSYSQKTIKQVMDFIDLHHTEKIEIQSLAKQFGMDSSYLMRQFKKISGVTINHYITETRIGQAQILLRDTQQSLEEISKQCGFDTVQYFHTVFKKVTGMTPRQYRTSQFQQ